jgi:hypothetical protein
MPTITNRLIFCCFAVFMQAAGVRADARFSVEKVWDVAEVPASFPVSFCLLTDGPRQYVAYYDRDRHMTVASRPLDSAEWEYCRLPTQIGWDTHNYIAMAVDKEGQLHVSGNMHNVPLIYFRTEKAGDISTLKRGSMTGELENRVTYPGFLTDQNGDLIFTYRHGGSGDGINLYNRYDAASRTWTRLVDVPLFDGERKMNAYPQGPVRGPDGWFHVVWVWRDTPDCATNHHLSHARSRDLIHWESIFHETIELPITLSENRLWVDPIPSHGGIINGCQKLFFDRQNQPVISYHKLDENGHMQIYAARPERGRWEIHQLTEWDRPIEFGGTGSMGFIGIRIGEPVEAEPGLLTLSWHHRDYGRGRLVLDEKTLRPVEKNVHMTPELPSELSAVQSDFEGMGIQRCWDTGDAGTPGVRYMIQWETLGRNHDRPRSPPLPEPGMLKLYKLRATGK